MQELNILETVRRNRRTFEPDSKIIDSLYMQIQENAYDPKRATFTETSSPGKSSHCSQEPKLGMQ